MSVQTPIGIFDSGMGGLSVLKEIRKILPAEDIIYVADSGYVPYGDKSPEFINQRCERIAEFLVARGAKALVIACNTASATAIMPLRKKWPQIPVIGMEPAVKPARSFTKTKVIGVLATVGTLKSARFAALLDKFGRSVEVVTQPAPGLVECVERGDLESEETRRLVASFVTPLLEKKVDVIVLGCTHYPFLRRVISDLAGPHVALIDTGAAVATQLVRKLRENNSLCSTIREGQASFFSTGALLQGENTLKILWNKNASLTKIDP